MTPRLLILSALIVLVAAAAFFGGSALFGIKEKAEPVLVLDEIIVLRTPGGMLEVSTLVRNEEFKWSTSHACPVIDCGKLLGKTVSQLRVPVHYTYRIPLAANWTLKRKGDHYELVVPAEVPASPAAPDLSKLEIQTERGWLAPNAAQNRVSLLTHFGGEIDRRALQSTYIHAQREAARKTVGEFARKWMIEQGKGTMAATLAITVVFPGES